MVGFPAYRARRTTIGLPGAPSLRYAQELLPGRCQHCCRDVVFVRLNQEPNHRLHALLSLLTGGIWLPVWILTLYRAAGQPWECAECGCQQKHIERPPAIILY